MALDNEVFLQQQQSNDRAAVAALENQAHRSPKEALTEQIEVKLMQVLDRAENRLKKLEMAETETLNKMPKPGKKPGFIMGKKKVAAWQKQKAAHEAQQRKVSRYGVLRKEVMELKSDKAKFNERVQRLVRQKTTPEMQVEHERIVKERRELEQKKRLDELKRKTEDEKSKRQQKRGRSRGDRSIF